MDIKAVIKNIFIAFLAQGVSFLVSVVTALFVPKVLGVDDFGYLQLFLFYTSYYGVFLFGLCDGIYLLHGGDDRSQVDKREINSQFLVGFLMQLITCSVIVFSSIFFVEESQRAFVFCSFAVMMVISNMAGLLGYTFQAMNETKLYSYSIMVDRFVLIVPILVMVVVHCTDYHLYVFAYILARLACLLFCMWQGRDLLRAGYYDFRQTARLSLSSIKVGYKLMIAGIADILILGVCRAIVDIHWGIYSFAQVSFAITIVNFFITFVYQVSMVLFPALRRSSAEELKRIYTRIRDMMALFFPGVYILYCPLAYLLTLWLPHYETALQYFVFLIPICVFNTKMDLCCSTYFKVLRMEAILFKVNLFSVLISLVIAVLGAYVFESIEIVLIGAVISSILRLIYSERLLNKKMNIMGNKMLIGEVVLTGLFIIGTDVAGAFVAMFIYAAGYALFLLLNKKTVKSLSEMIKARRIKA